MNKNNPSVRQRDRIAAKYSVPGSGVRLLSVPEKMPGFSWSLPAGKSCPYMVLGENAICGDKEGENGGHKHCYAFRGHYIYRNIVHATATRFQWVRDCLKTVEGTETFISTMVTGIQAACEASGQWYFRIHDSGDLFSPAYTRAWAEIVKRLPDVQFWIPTRSWQAMKQPAWNAAMNDLAILPNISVRPSALYFDDAPPIVTGLHAGTSVSREGYNCPAHAQDNKCMDCRACWTDKETPIIYRRH